MKIYYKNHLEELKTIVSTQAIYQKVMLVYDETVSDLQISDVYNEIKNFCIYNQMEISNLNQEELNNGYKLVIYLCGINSFLNLQVNRSEQTNVYWPQDKAIMPYFLYNFKFKLSNDILLIDGNKIDINIVSSVCFNKFYNYIKNILCVEDVVSYNSNFNKELTHYNMVELLENLNDGFEFLDVQIINEKNIDYKYLPMVDLILIDAFICFINSIKNHQEMLVDVYKVAKDDYALIDKMYILYNNESVKNLIMLNYNCLYNMCINAKQHILDSFTLQDYNESVIELIINQIKTFAKSNNDIISYLYLYNIFNV